VRPLSCGQPNYGPGKSDNASPQLPRHGVSPTLIKEIRPSVKPTY
jgi:hypothetical protein